MSQSRYEKLKLLTVPKTALLAIAKEKYPPAATILVVLYETYFLDLGHRNPVKLTSEHLRVYKISKDQKRRALQVLEKYDLVTVDRINGKNPLVTLNWPLPFMKHGPPSRLRQAR